LRHFICHILCLLVHQKAGKGCRLFFKVEEVRVNANIFRLVHLDFLGIVEECVGNRLELLGEAPVADDKEKDQLLDIFGSVVAFARVVNVVQAVGIRVQVVLVFLALNVNVLQQSVSVNETLILCLDAIEGCVHENQVEHCEDASLQDWICS